METNRRDLCVALAALAAAGGQLAKAQQATGQTAKPVLKLDHSQALTFDSLPAKTNATGGVTRAVLTGDLVTGEFVEVHETTLPPGQMPHPAHRHAHSEMLLVREGRLEVLGEGAHGVVGPGGVIFQASGILHGIRNVGDTPATYFVVAVGVQKALE